MKLLSTIEDLWRTGHAGWAAVAARQQTRLMDLVEFARIHSPYYRKLYEGLPPRVSDVRCLPPVTRAELMANFDEWVTDAAVSRSGVEDFMVDERLVGCLYLGRYTVWKSSGTTGPAAIHLQDRRALNVGSALSYARGFLTRLAPGDLGRIQRRWAWLIMTGGHFGALVYVESLRRQQPRQEARMPRVFSVLSPLDELVRGLNAFQPLLLTSYPTALALLAQEQEAGRLKIHPGLVCTGAELLAPEVRERVESAFGCSVLDNYSSAQAIGIAFDCAHRWLHVNADWVVLEPVDEEYCPVPPGRPSHTVLLTNLANRAQPIIRYDLGDSITVKPDPCPCGSPLPAIRVEGRRNDILPLEGPDGGIIRVQPTGPRAVVMGTRGVRNFQMIQTAPATLSVRLEATPGEDSQEVWGRVARRLREYLSAQGLPSVSIERSLGPPKRDPVSGKFRNVYTELQEVDHLYHRGR